MKRKKGNTSTGEIRSIADAINLLKRHQDGIFAYRGEDSSEYALLPKLGRHLVPDYDWSDVEMSLLDSFKRRSYPYTHGIQNDLQWLTLAQHHGLATRLIDWTLNPLVALFFATNTRAEQDCMLYAFNTEHLNYIDDCESPFGQGKVVLHEPCYLSPRVGAQRGLFSIHPNPTTPWLPDFLERWVIKKAGVPRISIELEQLGINYESVFPCLDGVARQANRDHLDFF